MRGPWVAGYVGLAVSCGCASGSATSATTRPATIVSAPSADSDATPRFALAADECATRPAASGAPGGAIALTLSYFSGFPETTFEGRIERNGRVDGVLSHEPNGPGPGDSQHVHACMPPGQAAAIFDRLTHAPPVGAAAPSGAVHCIDRVELAGGRSEDHPRPEGESEAAARACFRADVATDLVEPIDRAASADAAAPELECPVGLCSIEIAAGVTPHYHYAYGEVARDLLLRADGRLECRTGADRAMARMSADDARRVLEWLGRDVGATATSRRPTRAILQPYDEVVLRRGNDFDTFTAATPEYEKVLARWRNIAPRLPPACSGTPAPHEATH